MGVEFGFDYEQEKLTRFLNRMLEMGRRAGDIRTAMEAVADDFLKVERRVFDSDGRAAGQRWTPLAETYAANKQREGRGIEILELLGGKGGRLREAMTKRGASWQVRDIGRDHARMGTSLGIAKIHQRGGRVTVKSGPNKGRRYRIPARPFVVLTPEVKDRWEMIMRTYVVDGEIEEFRFGL
jgi:phage gpG-like protein